jgi:hypothetical protein
VFTSDTAQYNLINKGMASLMTPKTLSTIDPINTLWGQYVMLMSCQPEAFDQSIAIVKVLSLKWNAFGRKAVMRELCHEAFAVCLLTILVMVDWDNRSPAARIALSAIMLIVCFLRLGKELMEARSPHARILYILSIWNWLDVSCYVLAVPLCALRFGGIHSPHEFDSVLMILAWTKLLQFLSLVRMFVSHLMMIGAMIGDIFKFGCVFASFWLSFSLAFHLLLRDTNAYGFSSVPESVVSCFNIMLGDTMIDSVREGGSFAIVLWGAYTMIVVLLLLNMLIAMMSSSYDSVRVATRGQARLMRALNILRMERALKPAEKEKMWDWIFEQRGGGDNWLTRTKDTNVEI